MCNTYLFLCITHDYLSTFKYYLLPTAHFIYYLKTKQSDWINDIVLSWRPCRWQNCGHVIHSQREEQQEPKQMTPDVHRLIGQNEYAVGYEKSWVNEWQHI